MIVAAIAVVAALGAGAVAVLAGGSDPDDSASDTTLDTVAPDETAPEDTLVDEEEPFEEVDLRAGLLSALEVNGTIGTEGLQVAGDEVALFADILCDADDFVDQSAIVDYQSRFFDDPDAPGKVVAVGIIQFADTETADTSSRSSMRSAWTTSPPRSARCSRPISETARSRSSNRAPR